MDAINRIIKSFGDLKHATLVDSDDGVRFSSDDVQEICNLSIDFFKNQPNVLMLHSPINVVGDLHGNINDLLMILAHFSPPPESTFLFLGDYVDRGMHSLSVITLLLALMIKYPNNVFILRGNHEFGMINRYYGFFDEIITKYSDDSLWNSFQEVFNYMPLSAVIDNNIFCVHGGISPQLKAINDINKIRRPLESYQENQMICDMLWSDPADVNDAFTENRRGLGVMYSEDALTTFLKNNKLSLMIRAHQCVINGIGLFARKKGMTVFSSSKYNQSSPNKGGVICIPDSTSINFYSLDFSYPADEQINITLYLHPNDLGLHQNQYKPPADQPAKSHRSKSEDGAAESKKKTTKKSERRHKSRASLQEIEQAEKAVVFSEEQTKGTSMKLKSNKNSHSANELQKVMAEAMDPETELLIKATIEETKLEPQPRKRPANASKCSSKRRKSAIVFTRNDKDSKKSTKRKHTKSSVVSSPNGDDESESILADLEESESLFEKALKKL